MASGKDMGDVCIRSINWIQSSTSSHDKIRELLMKTPDRNSGVFCFLPSWCAAFVGVILTLARAMIFASGIPQNFLKP